VEGEGDGGERECVCIVDGGVGVQWDGWEATSSCDDVARQHFDHTQCQPKTRIDKSTVMRAQWPKQRQKEITTKREREREREEG
jgi:hypothetical protein